MSDSYRCERCGAEVHGHMTVCPICGNKMENKELKSHGHVVDNHIVINKKIFIGTLVGVSLLMLTLVIALISNMKEKTSGILEDTSMSDFFERKSESDDEKDEITESTDEGEHVVYGDLRDESVPEGKEESMDEVSSVEEILATSNVEETVVITTSSNQPVDDSSNIHKYLYIHADVSWEEAWDDSIAAGGYLARINSPEEFDYVTNILDSYTASKINYVYLGGIRDNEFVYHWMNENGKLFDEDITSSWYAYYWYPGEPSYYDPEEYKSGRYLPEYCVCLMNTDGTWYLNDGSGDLANAYEDGYSKGRIGYVIEFEN